MSKNKNMQSKAAVLALLLSLCRVASADTLTFEDLYPGGDTFAPLDTSYGGFTWGNDPAFVTNTLVTGRGIEFGTTGLVSVITAPDGNITFSRATNFNLGSIDITSAWNVGEQVLVQGLRNGTVVFSTQVSTSYDHAYTFGLNFLNVDTVSISGSGGIDGGDQNGAGEHLVIDNVVTTPVVSAVPEPAPIVMAGLGLLGMMFSLRRRSKASKL